MLDFKISLPAKELIQRHGINVLQGFVQRLCQAELGKGVRIIF
ncbi:MAG: hypothetical protein R8M45_03030 [Ghiorsea sp.]